jgi:broad specificity phosphatase PhoE
MTSELPRRNFYFLRHGQTAWNVEGRFQGHSDIPLNEVGLAQARDAAKILARCPIDLIVASPLIRARRTAEVVSEALDRPLLLDDELKERHFGALEGLVVNEV